MNGFEFSQHALVRFRERFPKRLISGVSTRQSAHAAAKGATLERGFLNDSRRIVWMLEKYGDFNYDYYLKDDVVYVCKSNVVITVMNRDDSGMVKQFGPKTQPRFRKKTCQDRA